MSGQIRRRDYICTYSLDRREPEASEGRRAWASERIEWVSPEMSLTPHASSAAPRYGPPGVRDHPTLSHRSSSIPTPSLRAVGDSFRYAHLMLWRAKHPVALPARLHPDARAPARRIGSGRPTKNTLRSCANHTGRRLVVAVARPSGHCCSAAIACLAPASSQLRIRPARPRQRHHDAQGGARHQRQVDTHAARSQPRPRARRSALSSASAPRA